MARECSLYASRPLQKLCKCPGNSLASSICARAIRTTVLLLEFPRLYTKAELLGKAANDAPGKP